MATAKRRINSTGRKRIRRELVEIRLEPPKPLEPLVATASVKLDGLDFPSDAAVILESYQRSSGMRFDCGTVGAIKVPERMRLTDMDSSGSVLFRLKIIDGKAGSGRILGAANRIRPGGDEDVEGRRSLFPIKERDLGPEVWRVEIDEAGPVLALNYLVPSFKHRILESDLLKGMILPAAFRIVLEHIAADPGVDEDDSEDWRGLWLRYLRETFGIDDDVAELDPEEREVWVHDAVKSFCESHGLVDKIRAMTEGTD